MTPTEVSSATRLQRLRKKVEMQGKDSIFCFKESIGCEEGMQQLTSLSPACYTVAVLSWQCLMQLWPRFSVIKLLTSQLQLSKTFRFMNDQSDQSTALFNITMVRSSHGVQHATMTQKLYIMYGLSLGSRCLKLSMSTARSWPRWKLDTLFQAL